MMARLLGPYGFVAGLCVVVHLAILVGGDRLGLHYALSTTLSFISCVAIGYSLHSRLTFGVPASLRGLSRYTLAMALNYPLSILAVWLFYRLLGQPMAIAAPASTLAMTLYNFVSSRWAITGSQRAPQERAPLHD